MSEDWFTKPFPGVHRIGPLCWQTGIGVWWFRLFGRGLHGTTHPPLFSERNGYVRTVSLGRWRFKYLKGHRR